MPTYPKPTLPGHPWKWGWDLGTPASRSCGGGSVTPHAPLLLQAVPPGSRAQAEPPALPLSGPSQLRAACPGCVSTLHGQSPSGPFTRVCPEGGVRWLNC